MKKTRRPIARTASLAAVLASLAAAVASAQQWEGSTTTSGSIHRDGKVGIGTDAPDRPLHIKSSQPAIRLEHTATEAAWNIAGREHLYFAKYVNSSFVDFLILDSDGNFGIGAQPPERRLHVGSGSLINDQAGSGSIIGGYVMIGGPKGPALRKSLLLDYGKIQARQLDTNPAQLWLNKYGGDVIIGTNSDKILLAQGPGNVGIGTNTPSTKLEVAGDTEDESSIILHNEGSPDNASHVEFQSQGVALAKIRAYTTNNSNASLRFHTIHGGSLAERVRIEGDGDVGIGTSDPDHPLQMGSGAYCSSAGKWKNASSRQYKERIRALEIDTALALLEDLDPVRFYYKADPSAESLGFIAEDVPELIAGKERKGLSSMDIVAVLTRVVQQQQQEIAELRARLDALPPAD